MSNEELIAYHKELTEYARALFDHIDDAKMVYDYVRGELNNRIKDLEFNVAKEQANREVEDYYEYYLNCILKGLN
jgi:hypothetical protein